MERPRVFRRRAGRMKVLVVEDDPLFQAMLEHWLDGDTFRARLAGSLDEARALVRSTRFDLIVLDLNLPDARGIETLDQVQALADDAPVVVLTGEDEEGLGLEAVRHGAQDFMEKAGIDPASFQRDLRYAIERKNVERERRRAELLQAKNQRLADLDAAKGRFYHAAAEDLAVPLQPILLELQVVRMEMPPDASAGLREAVDGLQGAVGDLDRRLRDLLAVTGIQAGAIHGRKRRVDLGAVVRRVVALHEPRARGNRLAFDAMLAPEAPVWGDDQRLAEVLTHLLDNAVRCTPGGGRLLVRLDVEGDDAVLRVEDDGVGMDPAAVEGAFEHFLEHAPGEEAPRRGLGLAFCKAVVEDHGGTIHLESPGPGEGTTAAVRLPVARGPLRAA